MGGGGGGGGERGLEGKERQNDGCIFVLFTIAICNGALVSAEALRRCGILRPSDISRRFNGY